MVRKFLAVLLLISIFGFLILVGLLSFVPHSEGKGPDGDSTLCGRPWGASGWMGKLDDIHEVLVVRSECEVVPFDTFFAQTVPPKQKDVAEWERNLWSIGRTPRIVYRYRLTINNDRDREIHFNLSDWAVVHSPFTLLAQDFSIRIPACHKVRYEFYSPWAPEIRYSPINVGFMTNEKEWAIEGQGQASIVIPVWFQFSPGGKLTTRLETDEVHSSGCRSN